MALDRQNYRQVMETTVKLVQKVGFSEMNKVEDEVEPYPKTVMETITKVMTTFLHHFFLSSH